MRFRRYLLLMFVMLLSSQPASAVLTIEITEGVAGAQPISVVPFAQQGFVGRLPVDVAQVIADDLGRSGRFKVLPRADMLSRPTTGDLINFRNWQALGQDNLVIGSIQQEPTGRYVVQFELFDVFKSRQLIGFRIPDSGDNLRGVAHRISDIIYEKLTGQAGAFSTRIAYVTSVQDLSGKHSYQIQVADADGFAPKTIVTSTEPLMSPAWSPSGNHLTYVSFEKGRSSIYTQTLTTGQREKLQTFKGINGAPSWSPDGTRLAVTLSKDGSADIYLYNVITRQFSRLTTHYAIDTEPDWSPDGRFILFTSDRGGKPQLYRVPVNGGRVERITYEGDYNARGRYSPDGKSICMVHRVNGAYRIGLMDVATGFIRVLTEGSLDESPSFAPNGSMILYSTKDGRRSVLAAVSSDGRVHQRLRLQGGEVREPAWSP